MTNADSVAGMQEPLIVRPLVGYVLPLNTNSLAVPLDATTYYFGGLPAAAPSTTGGARRAHIPKTGRVRRIDVVMFATTPGTAETSSLYLRVNNSTDYLISAAIQNDQNVEHFANAAMGVPVRAGDFVELKWVTPTWATNPLDITSTVVLYIE